MHHVSICLTVISLFWILTGCEKTKSPQSSDGKNSSPKLEAARPGLDTPVKHDGLQVYVHSAKVEQVPLQYKDKNDGKTTGEVLIIRFDLENLSANKKVDYQSWADAPELRPSEYASLHDNFGNGYKIIKVFPSHPVDSVSSESEPIHPGKTVKDAIMFEKPIPGATHLDLDLPAKNFGGDGVVRFRLPVPKK
ncbi:hypothetical protein [Zavarzinella formosa]|uniref:hypothetical protein n=1 Tax=Zavarzinella formosa TaxID=360055 RepID=UPI00030D2D29|nr:hypothetical protein [Zavarzinella formosa]